MTTAITNRYKVDYSLDIVKECFINKRFDGVWWLLVEDTTKSRRRFSHCMSLFDLVGIGVDAFRDREVGGREYKTNSYLFKDGSGYQVEVLSDVSFVAVCSQGGPHGSNFMPSDAYLVKKTNASFIALSRQIRDRLDNHYAAKLMYPNSNEEKEEKEEEEEEEAPDVDMSMDTDYDNATTQERQRALDYTDDDVAMAMDTDTSANVEDTRMDTSNSNAAMTSFNTTDMGSALKEAGEEGDDDDKIEESVTVKKRKNSKATITVPVQKESAILSSLLDDNGDLKEEVAKELADYINKKKKLTPDEMKLTGSLVKASIRSDKDKSYSQLSVVKLPVRSQNATTIVTVPTTYGNNKNPSSSSSKKKKKKPPGKEKKQPSEKAAKKAASQKKWRRSLKASEWLRLLENRDLQEYFLMQLLDENDELAKRVVKRFYNKHYTQDVETTCAMLSYAKVNPNQLKLMSRFMRDDVDNIQFFCAMDHIGKFKQLWWDVRLETRLYCTVIMQRQLRVKGGGTLNHPQTVVVFKVQPREYLCLDVEDLINTGEWIEGRKKCTVPWKVDDAFVDFGIVKMMQDAGGGSWKFTQNMINVSKPQGIENVRIVAEFSGAKDTETNVREACFKEGDPIKYDTEVISQRRCVVMTLTVRGVSLPQVSLPRASLPEEEEQSTQESSSEKNKTYAVVVTNTDTKHDINKPRPLPKLDGTTTKQAASISDNNKIGIVDVDFSQVRFVRLLLEEVDRRVGDDDIDGGEVDNTVTILGYTFCDERDVPMNTVFFRNPIKTPSIHPMPEMKQIQIGAVISPDLQFRSVLIGHQGMSAMYPCPGCFSTLRDMKDIFGPSKDSNLRTLESVLEGFANFKSLYLDKSVLERTPALKSHVTQNVTFSIAHRPQANTPFDAFLDALLHCRLGFSRTELDWIFDFFRKVEQMYTGDSLQLSRNIRLERDKLTLYLTWLDEEMTDVNRMIEGKVSSEKDIMKRLSSIQEVLDIPSISEATRARWEAKQATVQEDLKTLDNAFKLEDNEKEYIAQLIEVSAVTEDTIKYLNKVLTKHDGIHQRFIVNTLKDHGVDIQVYHSGVMNGPHCVKFADHGVEIMDEITKAALEHFGDNATLKAAIEDFGKQMKNILAIWYRIMKFLISVDYHTDEAIDKFADDIEKMRQAVVKLIKDEPSLGKDSPLKLPSTIKAHLLFDNNVNGVSHILHHVRLWHATGLFDEQNGEKTHAVVNHLNRMFGNRRGKGLKQLVMREFALLGSPIFREKINAMLERTQRKKGTSRTSVAQPMAKEVERETSSVVELPHDEDGVLLPATLTEDELEINGTVALRGPTTTTHKDYAALSEEDKSLFLGIDNKIYACPHCSMRLAGFNAFRIHCHETHEEVIAADLDGKTETTVAKVR